MITQQWGILLCMVPKQITLKRTVALVMCLAKLHNFCIDERGSNNSPIMACDEANLELEGAVSLESYNSNTAEGQHSQQALSLKLIGAGNHFLACQQVFVDNEDAI